MAAPGERVILLHGLWLGGYAMRVLAGRLGRAGFATEIFAYASLHGSPEAAARRLRERIDAAGDPCVHLVGHSLGGVVAALASLGLDTPGRTLCLGSPLAGSKVAARVARVTPWLIGQSRRVLIDGLPAWTGSRLLGMIAGDRGIGLGRLTGSIEAPHDGTVAVAETRLPGLAAHRVLPVTHSSLIFSAQVAEAALHFLRHGHFDR
ncbi:MAG: esterase/lipase family protein [Lysobacterales bacterium]